MPYDLTCNQDFLNFISVQGNKKSLPNLELLLNLEHKYPKIFIEVMSNFEKVKSRKTTLDDNGKPKKVSWKEAITEFHLSNAYEGITKENIDIAELFLSKGLSQKAFEIACKLRQEFKNENVPEHILGTHLKEETILESIERIKKQTECELISAKEMVEGLYAKQFTYDWLSKNDPHNSIMGLFCSCCATITSEFYGKDIAKKSVIAKDVQNLVIKDLNGNIISKGTMYVNKDSGYAVINDFELYEKYRKHETDESGRYSVDESSQDEQNREMIFKAFQRGLRTFIEEYDRQNPDNPLKQINVGMGYNRLKKQVERFEKETKNLTVPYEYSFRDAQLEQRILYKRPEKKQEIEKEEK